ncbi:hypothetical protein [Natronorarus salvus]|uniref:hypothetical protein n=1 Tax=Natronorarus salvus TaxID=3117733 RepID=UPI002F266766
MTSVHEGRTKDVGRCRTCGRIAPVYVSDNGEIRPVGGTKSCAERSGHEVELLGGAGGPGGTSDRSAAH